MSGKQPMLVRARTVYMTLQGQCRKAVHGGDLGRAEVLASRAHRVALHSGDKELLHLAVTNRSMVLLEAGKLREAERGLREVVLECSQDRLICRAAFYLASSLRRQHRVDRARIFLRTAAEKARRLEDPVLQARCENLAGNIHLDRGHFQNAADSYGRSLARWEAMQGDHRFACAIVMDNLGYCLTLEGQVHEGMLHIQAALDLSTGIHDRRTEAECRQDLSHAHLCLKEYSPARTHATAALSIAEKAGFLDIIKNCSYLLGEIAAMQGDMEESDLHFKRLQSYFPAFPHIRPFLHLFDISRLLTFH